MQNITDISLQKGEEIIWKGKAQLPGQRVHEYIPMLILILVYANSLHLLYPVEPLPMLHEFCSGNLAGGILLTGIVPLPTSLQIFWSIIRKTIEKSDFLL